MRARADHFAAGSCPGAVIYFAADRFHPSSSSYRYGWSVARRAVDFSAFGAKAT